MTGFCTTFLEWPTENIIKNNPVTVNSWMKIICKRQMTKETLVFFSRWPPHRAHAGRPSLVPLPAIAGRHVTWRREKACLHIHLYISVHKFLHISYISYLSVCVNKKCEHLSPSPSEKVQRGLRRLRCVLYKRIYGIYEYVSREIYIYMCVCDYMCVYI